MLFPYFLFRTLSNFLRFPYKEFSFTSTFIAQSPTKETNFEATEPKREHKKYQLTEVWKEY